MNNLLKFRGYNIKCVTMVNLRIVSSKLNLRKLVKNAFDHKYTRATYCTSVAEKVPLASIFEEPLPMTRIDKKKPTKPPFMKNTFVGVFDTDVLVYPEALDREELDDLTKRINTITDWFSNIQYDNSNSLPESILSDVNRLGLFKQQVSQEMGGLQLTNTETVKIQEVIASDAGLSAVLGLHQSCLKALLLYGTKEQKDKYVKNLISGKFLSTFCLAEKNVADSVMLHTKATWNEDNHVWVLNGEKHWVVNGEKADVFIVLAQTYVKDHKGKNTNTVTAFLVDRQNPGVVVDISDTVGVHSADMCKVTFTNVILEPEMILNDISGGPKVVVSVLPENYLNVGAECTKIVCQAVKKTIDHAINISHFNRKLMELEWVKQKMGKIAIGTYAMESMIYLTAGLKDMYKDQDCELENTIVKVFSTEHCFSTLYECASIFGAQSYDKNHFINRLIADSRRHLYFNETNNMLKLYIALLGLQHAGVQLSEVVRKSRNPLFNPGFVLRQIWEKRGHINDSPKLKLKLDYHLHPTLTNAAQWLEYCVLRFEFAIELLLGRYGLEIFEKHMDLIRIANMAMDIYAMTAVLGRASRSYCIGLHNADYEIVTAKAFCLDAKNRFRTIVSEIQEGRFTTNDENYLYIATKVFDQKKYFYEHPLTRNF